MKFWYVKHKYFDGGSMRTIVNDIEANEKPEDGKTDNKMCEEWVNYFSTYEEAKKFSEDIQINRIH